MKPLSACTIGSNPVRSANSPSRLYAGTEQYTSRGLIARQVSQSSPKRCITPVEKFSTSTSLFATSSFTTSRARGFLRSSAMLRLLRLAKKNDDPCAGICASTGG